MKKKIPLFILLFLSVMIIIYNYVFLMKIEIIGESMYPNLLNGEKGYVDKLFKNYKRFDVVVIDYNDNYIIKRIIGLPNETIYYKDNSLYVNDNKINEDFIDEEHKSCTCNAIDTITYNLCIDPIKLGENEYYVLGDNRYISNDSRYIGTINKDKIVGRLFIINDNSKFKFM